MLLISHTPTTVCCLLLLLSFISRSLNIVCVFSLAPPVSLITRNILILLSTEAALSFHLYECMTGFVFAVWHVTQLECGLYCTQGSRLYCILQWMIAPLFSVMSPRLTIWENLDLRCCCYVVMSKLYHLLSLCCVLLVSVESSAGSSYMMVESGLLWVECNLNTMVWTIWSG